MLYTIFFILEVLCPDGNLLSGSAKRIKETFHVFKQCFIYIYIYRHVTCYKILMLNVTYRLRCLLFQN